MREYSASSAGVSPICTAECICTEIPKTGFLHGEVFDENDADCLVGILMAWSAWTFPCRI